MYVIKQMDKNQKGPSSVREHYAWPEHEPVLVRHRDSLQPLAGQLRVEHPEATVLLGQQVRFCNKGAWCAYRLNASRRGLCVLALFIPDSQHRLQG